MWFGLSLLLISGFDSHAAAAGVHGGWPAGFNQADGEPESESSPAIDGRGKQEPDRMAPARDDLPRDAVAREQRFITNVFQITSAGRRAGEGYFSPDGKWMVFQSERIEGNPYFQIYLMNMEMGETQRVSPGFGKTTCAWIHPQTGDVMFSSTHGDPKSRELQRAEIAKRESGATRSYGWDYDTHYEIYLWDRETGDYSQLTDAPGYDAEGNFSPDGEWIVFSSNRHAYQDPDFAEDERHLLQTQPEYFLDIYLMSADGSEVKRLTEGAGYDGGPFFSPDGKRILWRKFDDQKGLTAEIWTMNVDGTDKRQITRMGHMSWAPYFHPSGKYIIFTTNKHGMYNFELYLVDAEGRSTPRRVSYSEKFDGLPVFSPDGTQLYWSSERFADRGNPFNAERQTSQIVVGDWSHKNALNALGLSDSDEQAAANE